MEQVGFADIQTGANPPKSVRQSLKRVDDLSARAEPGFEMPATSKRLMAGCIQSDQDGDETVAHENESTVLVFAAGCDLGRPNDQALGRRAIHRNSLTGEIRRGIHLGGFNAANANKCPSECTVSYKDDAEGNLG